MIVVFGSINVDCVARVPRLPRAGETLAAHAFSLLPGGKGANQALAAARAGASVHLFGCVGRDPMAAIALRGLREGGVELAGVGESDAHTGVALVHVDAAGENCITIAAGANGDARAAQVPDRLLDAHATLLMQLELPLDEVAAVARRARRRGARVIINAAPALALPAQLLGDVDVLIVNEAEASALAGTQGMDMRDVCSRLARDERIVVVTRGAKGAIYAHAGDIAEQRASIVDVVDTVGAGDAFSGALAAALDRGEALGVAVREGVAAGSLACMSAGAQDALPARDAIVRLAEALA
jgi:ribokinase